MLQMLFRAAFVLHFSQFLYARLKVNLSIHVGNCASTKSFIFVLLKINKNIRKFYDVLKHENYPILKLKTLTTTRNKILENFLISKFWKIFLSVNFGKFPYQSILENLFSKFWKIFLLVNFKKFPYQ